MVQIFLFAFWLSKCYTLVNFTPLTYRMQYSYYEDESCYYVWKPAGLHSTFGQEYSFLEQLRDEKEDLRILAMMDYLAVQFGEQEEFWLLNRLDTLTTWLLYFAKTPLIKKEYKKKQMIGKIQKRYLLEVWWDLSYRIEKKGKIIDFPIAHHKFSDDRMVVVASDMVLHKIKGTLHQVQTTIQERSYSALTKTTMVLVTIQKWIRHQIRSHFSEIWYPLLGDPLYGKKKDPRRGNLQLFSVGLKEIEN